MPPFQLYNVGAGNLAPYDLKRRLDQKSDTGCGNLIGITPVLWRFQTDERLTDFRGVRPVMSRNLRQDAPDATTQMAGDMQNFNPGLQISPASWS